VQDLENAVLTLNANKVEKTVLLEIIVKCHYLVNVHVNLDPKRQMWVKLNVYMHQ